MPENLIRITELPAEPVDALPIGWNLRPNEGVAIDEVYLNPDNLQGLLRAAHVGSVTLSEFTPPNRPHFSSAFVENMARTHEGRPTLTSIVAYAELDDEAPTPNVTVYVDRHVFDGRLHEFRGLGIGDLRVRSVTKTWAVHAENALALGVLQANSIRKQEGEPIGIAQRAQVAAAYFLRSGNLLSVHKD